MRDKIEEVGIHFSKRRTSRDKLRFMNRLIGQLKARGLPLQMIQKKSRSGVSNHLVAGDCKKSRWVFMASYDTGTRMLNPCYEYCPLNSKHNFREEMKNVAAYSVLTLLVAALAVFWTRSFAEYSILWKVLTVIGDMAVLGLIYRWMKRPGNKVNMNRNSGAVSVLYDCAEKAKKGCFVFVDHGAMTNQGFYEVAEQFESRYVLMLDCIASGEELFLAHRTGQEDTARKLAEAFDCDVHLLPLNEEQYRNTPLMCFQNGFMLTLGTLKKETVYVKHARRSSDMDMDLERMQQIEDGILRLCAQ